MLLKIILSLRLETSTWLLPRFAIHQSEVVFNLAAPSGGDLEQGPAGSMDLLGLFFPDAQCDARGMKPAAEN